MCQSERKNSMLYEDVGMKSIVGTRKEQQDTILLEQTQDSLIAAICDGMGGLQNGKQASKTACDTLRALYLSKPRTERLSHFLLRSVDVLDESVFALRRKSKSVCVGTTIVAAIVSGENLYWLSVGDSRLYIIRGDEIVCVTSDHNYNLILEPSYRAGKMSYEEYEIERKKGEALISYIGMGGIDLMDANSQPFRLIGGDVVVLMSDGLYRHIHLEEIMNAASYSGSAQELADRLISISQNNAHFGQDNASVVVIKVNGANSI